MNEKDFGELLFSFDLNLTSYNHKLTPVDLILKDDEKNSTTVTSLYEFYVFHGTRNL